MTLSQSPDVSLWHAGYPVLAGLTVWQSCSEGCVPAFFAKVTTWEQGTSTVIGMEWQNEKMWNMLAAKGTQLGLMHTIICQLAGAKITILKLKWIADSKTTCVKKCPVSDSVPPWWDSMRTASINPRYILSISVLTGRKILVLVCLTLHRTSSTRMSVCFQAYLYPFTFLSFLHVWKQHHQVDSGVKYVKCWVTGLYHASTPTPFRLPREWIMQERTYIS